MEVLCAKHPTDGGVFRGRVDRLREAASDPPVRPGHPQTGVAICISVPEEAPAILPGPLCRFWR